MDFKKRVETGAAAAPQLLDEGERLLAKYGKADVPWLKELKDILDRLRKKL